MSVKEGLSNYTMCKNKALARSKKYKNTKKRKAALTTMLTECREEYPSYFMMSLCKSKALKTTSSPTDFKLAMKDCRYEYAKLKYNPKSIIAATWHKEKIYFAGVALKLHSQNQQKRRYWSEKSFGNFNCENVINSKKDPNYIEYILIGKRH